jgi:hypothetical protein
LNDKLDRLDQEHFNAYMHERDRQKAQHDVRETERMRRLWPQPASESEGRAVLKQAEKDDEALLKTPALKASALLAKLRALAEERRARLLHFNTIRAFRPLPDCG